MVNADLHVVFGAGQVGYPLAQGLLAGGKRVRIVKRSAADIPAGCLRTSRRVWHETISRAPLQSAKSEWPVTRTPVEPASDAHEDMRRWRAPRDVPRPSPR
jgi:hypothetical protein